MLSPQFLEIVEEARKEQPIVIVEGARDGLVLKMLGFTNVIEISGKPIEEILEKIISKPSSEVVILTDFDKEGERLASELITLLSHYKININHFIRRKFKSIKIQKIEELNSFIKLMEDYQNGKISSIYYKIFNRSRIFDRRNSRKT
ncbi:MAG: toprim domain-containing protein [Candidatus Aenigmatarchaeota archaeon]